MSNKFLELSSSPLMNLDHTKRYSGTKLVEEETLSQHIVDTIMMGIKIIDEINHIADKEVVDAGKYVLAATYHDLEEVITGDIPRPLKYYDEATLTSMRSVADQVAKKLFSSQFYEAEKHYEIWDQAKSREEGYILKIVDTLVVANKVVKEVKLLNNYYMLRVAHEVTQYLRQLKDSVYSTNYFNNREITLYLIDIIEGAINMMDSILEANEDIMQNLKVSSQSMI